MMAIAVAAVLHAAGYRRTLVISPPHLVYKWRREILETMPGVRVWVLNGPDTLVKLLKLRDQSRQTYDGRPEFFILGRVRMRMGFHWRLACWKRRAAGCQLLAACPDCGQVLEDLEGNRVTVDEFERGDRRRNCTVCGAALWTLIYTEHDGDSHVDHQARGLSRILADAFKSILTLIQMSRQKLQASVDFD